MSGDRSPSPNMEDEWSRMSQEWLSLENLVRLDGQELTQQPTPIITFPKSHSANDEQRKHSALALVKTFQCNWQDLCDWLRKVRQFVELQTRITLGDRFQEEVVMVKCKHYREERRTKEILLDRIGMEAERLQSRTVDMGLGSTLVEEVNQKMCEVRELWSEVSAMLDRRYRELERIQGLMLAWEHGVCEVERWIAETYSPPMKICSKNATKIGEKIWRDFYKNNKSVLEELRGEDVSVVQKTVDELAERRVHVLARLEISNLEGVGTNPKLQEDKCTSAETSANKSAVEDCVHVEKNDAVEEEYFWIDKTILLNPSTKSSSVETLVAAEETAPASADDGSNGRANHSDSLQTSGTKEDSKTFNLSSSAANFETRSYRHCVPEVKKLSTTQSNDEEWQLSRFQDALPYPWIRCIQPLTLAPFYYNPSSGQVQWSHPLYEQVQSRIIKFNCIPFTAYRCSAKLRLLQRELCTDFFNLPMLEEAFRHLSSPRLITAPQLTSLLYSLYTQVATRIPPVAPPETSSREKQGKRGKPFRWNGVDPLRQHRNNNNNGWTTTMSLLNCGTHRLFSSVSKGKHSGERRKRECKTTVVTRPRRSRTVQRYARPASGGASSVRRSGSFSAASRRFHMNDQPITPASTGHSGGGHGAVGVALCVDLCLNWLLAMFDPPRTGFVPFLHVQVALALLSGAPVVDKYKYIFRRFSHSTNSSWRLDESGLLQSLQIIFHVPASVQEVVSPAQPHRLFAVVKTCFVCKNSYEEDDAEIQTSSRIPFRRFQEWLEGNPAFLAAWLGALHRFMVSETSVHPIRCSACKVRPIRGLRYRCLRCLHYNLCQTCFLSGAESRGHQSNHPLQEYCLPGTSSETLRDLSCIVRNKIKGPPSIRITLPLTKQTQRTTPREKTPAGFQEESDPLLLLPRTRSKDSAFLWSAQPTDHFWTGFTTADEAPAPLQYQKNTELELAALFTRMEHLEKRNANLRDQLTQLSGLIQQQQQHIDTTQPLPERNLQDRVMLNKLGEDYGTRSVDRRRRFLPQDTPGVPTGANSSVEPSLWSYSTLRKPAMGTQAISRNGHSQEYYSMPFGASSATPKCNTKLFL